MTIEECFICGLRWILRNEGDQRCPVCVGQTEWFKWAEHCIELPNHLPVDDAPKETLDRYKLWVRMKDAARKNS